MKLIHRETWMLSSEENAKSALWLTKRQSTFVPRGDFSSNGHEDAEEDGESVEFAWQSESLLQRATAEWIRETCVHAKAWKRRTATLSISTVHTLKWCVTVIKLHLLVKQQVETCVVFFLFNLTAFQLTEKRRDTSRIQFVVTAGEMIQRLQHRAATRMNGCKRSQRDTGSGRMRKNEPHGGARKKRENYWGLIWVEKGCTSVAFSCQEKDRNKEKGSNLNFYLY